MSKLAKVEGQPDLARNKSGAIVNINSSKINQARKAKAKRREEQDNQRAMEARLARLEYRVNRMLNILEGMSVEDG